MFGFPLVHFLGLVLSVISDNSDASECVTELGHPGIFTPD